MNSITFIFFLLYSGTILAQDNFTDFFTGQRLRFDYGIFGTESTTRVINYKFYKESFWGGSQKNLIDTMRYGDFMLEVYDSISDKLIYSRGYSTLFKEWKSTGEALVKERLFLESVVMPFPINAIKIVLLERDFEVKFREVHRTYLDPAKELIELKSSPQRTDMKKLVYNGATDSKLDVVILSEGYSEEQKFKFFNDAERFKNLFFQWKPYEAFFGHINFYAAFSPSDETGTDIPTDSLWMNTTLDSQFNTFNLERYLTTENIYRVRDLLADVPYDQVCIMVNTDRYGGGGIYNYYTVFTSDHQDSEFLFHHEFGHAFAALGDEYFKSEVAYINMFNLKREPYQPNLTTLVDFDTKWENMVLDTVPIPTPNQLIYSGVVGVFEGAGYSAEGIYRPYYNCSMKSVMINAFCPVCKKAIEQMISFYSK